MAEKRNASNSGVHAVTGFEFQKHCALGLLFGELETLKDRKYFICLESHDDVLFCYESKDGLINKVNAYQAKKSSDHWGMNDVLFEILHKLLVTVKNIELDPIDKTEDCEINPCFLTNGAIKLRTTPDLKICESNINVIFSELDDDLKHKIQKGVEAFRKTPLSEKSAADLKRIRLSYVDFGKTPESQKNQLVGEFGKIFGDKVRDHRAAVDTLLGLFREAELTLNQGGVPNLRDDRKRVDGDKIGKAIKILTTKSKAFEKIREMGSDLSRRIQIPLSEKSDFDAHLDNSFDLFKDPYQVEHQDIRQFVLNNKGLLETHYGDAEAIEAFLKEFLRTRNSPLSKLQLKAAICAGYIQLLDDLGNL